MSQPGNPFSQSMFESNIDIGSVYHPGKLYFDPNRQTYTLTGAGANIWGQQDDFHFACRRMQGDFIVTATASFVGQGVNPHRKLGWMARASLESNAPHMSAVIHGDGLISLQYRRTPGGPTEEARTALHGADVIQLERTGSTYRLSAAKFGEPFTSITVDDLHLADELYLGLFICSHEDNLTEQAVFHNVRIVKPAPSGFDRGKDPFVSHLEILDIASGNREIIYSRPEVFEAPNWMRDGQSLIFNSGGHLYRFDLKQQLPTLINTGDVIRNNNDHVLSFDGRQIAISSYSEAQHGSLIYTMPVEGGQPRLVTPTGPSYLHGWSPDGRYLVFTGQRDGIFNIYRVPAEGGPEEPLTNTPDLDDGPEYTPDGQWIYFNSVRSGRMQIWRMKPDGSQQEQMTNDEFDNWFPHVSPDGQSIIMITYLVGEVDPSDHPAAKRIYLRLMPLNGGQPKVVAYLYGGQGTINVPSWSPDGSQIAFVSNTLPI